MFLLQLLSTFDVLRIEWVYSVYMQYVLLL